MYITNIKRQNNETPNDLWELSTKVNEEEGLEDKKPPAKDRPLVRSSSINSNNELYDYDDIGSDNNEEKEIEKWKKPKKARKIIHMEFDSDDDEKEQTKNLAEGNQIEVEGKVHVKNKIIHYYEFSSEDNSKSKGKQAEYQKNINPRLIMKNQEKKKI